MKKVEREIRLTVRVSEDEAAQYARKMLIDGYIVNNNFDAVKQLAGELGSLARSINQIAKRVNETRNIYEQDIRDLQIYYFEVKQKVSEHLVKMLREEA